LYVRDICIAHLLHTSKVAGQQLTASHLHARSLTPLPLSSHFSTSHFFHNGR
jgi:hypothetical protein